MINMFSYRVFQQSGDTLLAIADAPLVGKRFEEGNLNLHVSSDFYRDNECGKNKAKELAEKATIINAVGKNIVALLVEEKLIRNENVLTIQGIPHAQIISTK